MTKKKNSTVEKELGSCSFYCKNCDIEFEIDWSDIFELQEMTHGYVGYDLNNLYISCPKCGEYINEENNKKDIELNPDYIPDKDLPF